jgi:hypothetical protein
LHTLDEECFASIRHGSSFEKDTRAVSWNTSCYKGTRNVFQNPRETKGHNGEFGKFVTQKKDTQLDIPKNMWTIPYLLHAYGVKRSNFQNKRKADKKGATNLTQKMQLNRVQFNKGDCVITNRVASRRKYTAKYFFSRKKALDLTIPLAVTDHAADINDDEQLYRRKEWQLYSTRVRHYTTKVC